MSNIIKANQFDINTGNYKSNYFKYHSNDNNGNIIDPIIVDLDTANSNNKLDLQKTYEYLLGKNSNKDLTEAEEGKQFNVISKKFKINDGATEISINSGNNIKVDLVNYNIKIGIIEKVIKSIKTSISYIKDISPLQGIYGFFTIILVGYFIVRILKLDFIDGIFGKVLENKAYGIDNVFKRLFLVFYLFIISHIAFTVINYFWGYSEYFNSLSTTQKDNDGFFITIGFVMSLAIFTPTYAWAYMSTNRFTRYVILFTILAIHLLFIDWISIPDVFNTTKSNEISSKQIEKSANVLSQIFLFIFIIFIIIYALYFKFHNKEIFASGYKNKFMYFIFFFLLVSISGYSSFLKQSYCNSQDDENDYFCKLLKKGKISLISIGSLLSIISMYVIYLIYKKFFGKSNIPDIEADSVNYFFVKTK